MWTVKQRKTPALFACCFQNAKKQQKMKKNNKIAKMKQTNQKTTKSWFCDSGESQMDAFENVWCDYLVPTTSNDQWLKMITRSSFLEPWPKEKSIHHWKQQPINKNFILSQKILMKAQKTPVFLSNTWCFKQEKGLQLTLLSARHSLYFKTAKLHSEVKWSLVCNSCPPASMHFLF